MRRLVLVTITLALLYASAAARANGRFPKAQAIAIAPGSDGRAIAMRATFGVLLSKDGGATWRWMCEAAMGFTSTWDPPIAASRDGRLWIALADGARWTSDGCAVNRVPELEGELVADLAVDAEGTRVLALTSTPGRASFVWRSDAGKPFARLGKGLEGFQLDTVEAAPSNPKRVYVTGVPTGAVKKAHVFRSDDGGVTLRELAPVLPTDGRLFVSAVDPTNPDRVLARLLASTGSDVVLSVDGGATFKSVLHFAGAMFGFARTRDGAAYYAGSGDPKEGIWASFDRGATWSARAKTSVFCLNAEGPDLLVCSNPYVPGGYAIARSTDRGATIAPLGTFDAVEGPVACAAGSPCDKTWPETRALLASTGRPPASTADAGAPPAGAAVADAGPSSASPARGGTCGCRAAGAGGEPGERAAAAFFGLVLLAGARARRGGSRSLLRRT